MRSGAGLQGLGAAEAEAILAGLRSGSEAIGGGAKPRSGLPAAAAQHALSGARADGIGDWCGGGRDIPEVVAPLPDVAGHIEESGGVRDLVPDRVARHAGVLFIPADAIEVRVYGETVDNRPV